MAVWSVRKAETLRKMIDVVRGLTVHIMSELHRRMAAPDGATLSDVMSRREVVEFWSEQKAAQGRLAAEIMASSGGFDAGEIGRASSRINSAMDAEAIRICQLDGRGAFDPDNLDERSKRLLAFQQERAARFAA